MISAHAIQGTRYAPRGAVEAGSLMLSQDQCRCLICETSFVIGQDFSMWETKPIDEANARKAEEGRRYIAYYEPAHWECIVIRLATTAGFMRQRAQA